ncbi:MAG: hypothetical protein ILO36_01475 [Abditibacteriota bacterium]|nr:hypothetical protein [Abditibacteriota bacterium]
MKKILLISVFALFVLSAAAYADKIYSHCVMQGAVLEKCFYDSTNFSYRTKCAGCGHVGSASQKVSGSNGATSSVFICPRCGRRQTLFIRNEILQPVVPEECSDVFYHTALEGGLITLQQPFAPDFYYRNRCRRCGRLSREEYYASSLGGFSGYTFDCDYCKKTQQVRFFTFTENIERMSLDSVYSHCAVKGAVITEFNPFSPRYGYREWCGECGALSATTLKAEDKSGERSYKFICPRCRKKQEVLITNYRE